MMITEFLLSRVSELEEAAREALVTTNRPTWPLSAGGTITEHVTWDRFGELASPARVLAECEAKRRIIALTDEATALDMQVDHEFRVGSRDASAEPYIGDLILRALAQPYAGHPDFDPAWRL